MEAKLGRLRSAMAEYGIHAYIIPSEDAHQVILNYVKTV